MKKEEEIIITKCIVCGFDFIAVDELENTCSDCWYGRNDKKENKTTK